MAKINIHANEIISYVERLVDSPNLKSVSYISPNKVAIQIGNIPLVGTVNILLTYDSFSAGVLKFAAQTSIPIGMVASFINKNSLNGTLSVANNYFYINTHKFFESYNLNFIKLKSFNMVDGQIETEF